MGERGYTEKRKSSMGVDQDPNRGCSLGRDGRLELHAHARVHGGGDSQQVEFLTSQANSHFKHGLHQEPIRISFGHGDIDITRGLCHVAVQHAPYSIIFSEAR